MSTVQKSAIQERFKDDSQWIQIACDRNPDFGVPLLVAPGIWWVRLPVASSLQAINVYLLEDGKGLTLIDTGVRSTECREALKAAMSHPDVASHKLNKIIVTHFHPDHIGLAGELARDGVELWTSRTTWLNCQLLSGNKQLLPLAPEVIFMQQAGLTGIELEAFRRRAANRYNALVAPPPDHYVPLVDGQTISIGQRVWRIAMSYGHAAEHVSLWSDDCVLSGDQILPSISSNLTVPYMESNVDVIGEWLRSCRSLMQIANNEALCLPGHQRPFYGIRSRLTQIDENVRKTLTRLQSIVTQSTAAIDCVEQVYGRAVANDERRLLLPEIVGMLNHLYFHGLLERTTDHEGVFRYTASTTKKTGRWVGLGKLKRFQANAESTDVNSKQDMSPFNHAIQFEEPVDDEPAAESESKSEYLESSVVSRLSRLMVLAAMCLVGAAIYWKWDVVSVQAKQLLHIKEGSEFLSASKLPAQAAIVPVDTMQVVNQTQAEVPRQFTGIVKPRRASLVGFNRIGVIDEILVQRGDRVEADTILARLNTNLLKANLKAVQAQYRAAEARLSELIAGPRAQTIESARAQVAAAKAELDLARVSFDRAQRLVTAGAVSRQELDNAKTNAAAKEEALKAVRNTLDELLEGTRSEQVLAQRAQLSELEATQEQLQVQLSESVLRSPFVATVSDRFIEPGAVTAPGAPAFRLIDAESPEVWIGVPPDYLSAIRNDKGVSLTIGERIYHATVKSVLPELDEVTRTNTVILELHGSVIDNSLFGQVARVELARKLDLAGFWVPLAALTQGDQGLWALLALESTDDKEKFILKRREVEVVQVDSDRAFVRGTVDSGTQLVSSGVRRLTPGQQVKLKSQLSESTLTSENFSVASDVNQTKGAAK
jgi:glyoxylase-like metal-dependent hydrolase (beta-lactamase superfamily II)/multidrug efflux pump subunit AcrA (membrane-fusion protein)